MLTQTKSRMIHLFLQNIRKCVSSYTVQQPRILDAECFFFYFIRIIKCRFMR